MRLIKGNKGHKNNLQLISIHIPKTGGRSFHEVLKIVYGDSLDKRFEKEHFFPDKNFTGLLNNKLLDDIRGIHGHLTISQVKPLINAYHPKVITWVRNPVDRVISNYYYFMKRIRDGKTPQKQLIKKDISLIDYARQPKRMNRMTAILEGLDLKDFFFIGLMEQFDQDIVELGRKMDWRKIDRIPHVNDSSGFKYNNDCRTTYEDIDEDLRSKIAAINEDDINLYNDILALRGVQ
jgi:hypothetical protein